MEIVTNYLLILPISYFQVTNSQEEAVYCLEHAFDFLSRNPSHLEYCKLMYTYSLVSK